MSGWANAFHRQAVEDFKALLSMNPYRAPSTYCMLIQMVFEKLVKAALTKSRGDKPLDYKHKVIRIFMNQHLRANNQSMIFAKKPRVIDFALKLEDGLPTTKQRTSPQLEYPWEDPNNNVHCPADDFLLAKRMTDPRDRIRVDVINFLRAFIKHNP